ncbi:uncharacterized protein YbjT (DUF2867 family) [Bradyrhizobium sp. LM3.4]
MTILVTGATGTIGRNVVEQLVKRGADVRALARDPAKANLPAGVTVVQGDLLDVDSLRSAFNGVSTLFLLNAVVADEFTQALIALNVAREAGVERVVYLSVIHSDRYVNVPHFAGKFGVERMIEQMGFNATILRPAYFMNNDLTIKDVVTGYGIYPMPIGSRGLAMIDARDIGEIAAVELIRRERAAAPLALDRINLVGPETLTGAKAAAVWSEVLGRTIAYPGDDTAGFEKNLRQFMPELDGLRHAADERAFPHRGNGPRGWRRRAADRAVGASPALLSRPCLRDRGLCLTARARLIATTCVATPLISARATSQAGPRRRRRAPPWSISRTSAGCAPARA